MIRSSAHRIKADGGNVDMTPMLDVVFILLIFFIVTATFLDETAIALTPPDGTDCDGETPVIVAIGSDDVCSVGGRNLPCERVVDATASAVAHSALNGHGDTVILRVDIRSRHRTLVETKSALDAAGFAPSLEPVRSDI